MRFLASIALLALTLSPTVAAEPAAADGPIELHIWLTAKAGREAALEELFTADFYPAVSAREGFLSAALMRKPDTADYTVRLSFDTEELRLAWVASDRHQQVWPALAALCSKTDYLVLNLIHPKR